MRQRKIKNIDEKLEAFGPLLAEAAEENRGRWRELFDGPGEERRRLYMEVGCGKGQFVTRLAARDPEGRYVAVEGLKSAIIRGLEKAAKAELTNLRFIPDYVDDLGSFVAPGELDGVFLNFSDPWPKARHAKRRLTAGKRLLDYAGVIRSGGFLRFKTDNDGLFAYTLEEIDAHAAEAGFRLAAMTHDLHDSPYAGLDPTTEYEDKFVAAGKKIHYLELVRE